MLASALPLALAALLIEAWCGYPAWLFRVAGHPVTWMGAALARLERWLNRSDLSFGWRRVAGVVALALLLTATAAVAMVPAALPDPLGFLVAVLLAAALPAQRSLHRHVAAVADSLGTSLEAGREAVAHIVGRNPSHLDEAGVARAAIESLAENFSDGVVAPAVWLAICGLPGGALYKAINTADSMIGHRTSRYAAFGWAAARLDDLVNLPASRLSAVWLVLAALLHRKDAAAAVRAVWRDAGRHRSPNAGWPEAAMAGALGVALNGPRVYGDTLVDDGYMGDGRTVVTGEDVRQALRLYRTACGLQILAVLTLTLAVR